METLRHNDTVTLRHNDTVSLRDSGDALSKDKAEAGKGIKTFLKAKERCVSHLVTTRSSGEWGLPGRRMFCQATGFGGTVQEGLRVEAKLKAREEAKNDALEKAAAARELTVSFNADVSDGLPWRFTPVQRSVKVKPGQATLIFYTAENRSDHAITGKVLTSTKENKQKLGMN